MNAELINIDGREYVQLSDMSGGIDIVDSRHYDALLDERDALKAKVTMLEAEVKKLEGSIDIVRKARYLEGFCDKDFGVGHQDPKEVYCRFRQVALQYPTLDEYLNALEQERYCNTK